MQRVLGLRDIQPNTQRIVIDGELIGTSSEPGAGMGPKAVIVERDEYIWQESAFPLSMNWSGSSERLVRFVRYDRFLSMAPKLPFIDRGVSPGLLSGSQNPLVAVCLLLGS